MKIFFPIIDNGMKLSVTDWGASMFQLGVSNVLRGHDICAARVSYPYPDGAMNLATDMFLSCGADRMIVIDTDLSFSAKDVASLISHDLDIVAGIYPLKQVELEFPIVPLDNDNPLQKPDGLHEVKCTARGFMSFKRRVFESMVANGECETYQDYNTGKPCHQFWFNKLGGTSEDFNFCDTWRKIGGKIFIDTSIKVRHHGSASFPINQNPN